ncbi:MAG: MFS transporter [Myxococcales bacterium]|nr:MAG: MFS transporter [Myxococcales bacterium]
MANGEAYQGLFSRFALATRALHSRNFRLFFAGQSISLVGTWMQRIAVSWLVYRLSGSAFLLGMVGFFSQIPTFVISPYAGVLADRLDRHRAIVVTQIMSMLQALILATLTLTNHIDVWQVLALSALLGVINGFDIPIRQSFMIEMVDKREDLGNAIALNSFMVNGARLIGPSVAGILIAVAGEGVCFLVNGLSYIAVIASLLAMSLPPHAARAQVATFGKELKDGFSYAFGSLPIRSILLLMALVSLMGMPYMVLMPVVAKDILHGGAHTLGFLTGASGAGALLGAVYLASRPSVVGLVRGLILSAALFGAGLILFSFSTVFWLSLPLLMVVGFAMMTQMAGSNTLLQTLVSDEMRGRVMSFFAMAFMGMAPFGSLLAGSLADWFGAPYALLVCGAACLLGAAWFRHLYPRLREAVAPIYVSKGILPAEELSPADRML